MHVNGIIAEYNPFHCGHHFQLNRSKELTSSDYTIVVMSGNYTQRGEPAVTDKYTRTKAALASGADLVLELPCIYATASAEYFAKGGVSLMNHLGVVDTLSFGSECGKISSLQKIAEILVNEPDKLKESLQQYLSQGFSFPVARTKALFEYESTIASDETLFTSPNNILGIEYLKQLLRSNSTIQPITVKRIGADYNSQSSEGAFPSALSLRKALFEGKPLNELSQCFTSEALPIYEAAFNKHIPIEVNMFSELLFYKLSCELQKGYGAYFDVTQDLSERIQNKLLEYKTYQSFCELLKTKNITYSRISRCLLHILLNITNDEIRRAEGLQNAPFTRILGFRKSAEPLLHSIKEHSDIPMIAKPADAKHILSKEQYELFQADLERSQLYDSIASLKSGCSIQNELSRPMIVL